MLKTLMIEKDQDQYNTFELSSDIEIGGNKIIHMLSYTTMFLIMLVMIISYINPIYSDSSIITSALLQLDDNKLENSKHNLDDIDTTEAALNKIKQFLNSISNHDTKVVTTKNEDELNDMQDRQSSFIDLGNNKLPILKIPVQDKQLNIPVELNQQIFSAKKAQLIESIKSNDSDIQQPNATSLPTIASTNIVEAITPDTTPTLAIKVVSTKPIAVIEPSKLTVAVEQYMPQKEIKATSSSPNNIFLAKEQNTLKKKIVHKKDKLINATEILAKLNKFTKDETQMLLLPNDEIVLGELTEQAKLEQMDIYSYIRLVKKAQDNIARANQRKIVDDFIAYYDNNFKR